MSQTEALERPSAGTQSIFADRDQLLNVLGAVRAVIESRNTLEILSNFRLTATDGALTVSGTDLDTWSQASISVDGEIDTTVKADRLFDAVKTMRPGYLQIIDLGASVEIKQARASRKLPTRPSSEFPPQKVSDSLASFEIEAGTFANLLGTARHTVCTAETMYFLCGVYLHVVGNDLAAAATDKYQVIQVRTPLPVGAATLPPTIISTKGVGLICRLLADMDPAKTVSVSVSERAIEVATAGFSVAAKVIDGTYPDYARVFDKHYHRKLAVQAAELERCFVAGVLAADGKTRCVRMTLDAEHCEVSAHSRDGGWSIEPMDADYEGEPLTLGVNYAYATAIVKAFGATSALDLTLGDAAELIIITSNNRPGVLAGIMPMHA